MKDLLFRESGKTEEQEDVYDSHKVANNHDVYHDTYIDNDFHDLHERYYYIKLMLHVQ